MRTMFLVENLRDLNCSIDAMYCTIMVSIEGEEVRSFSLSKTGFIAFLFGIYGFDLGLELGELKYKGVTVRVVDTESEDVLVLGKGVRERFHPKYEFDKKFELYIEQDF